MKKVMVFLDDETGGKLQQLAQRDYRSVKSMAEKIIMDNVRRSDGFTDNEYIHLSKSVKEAE